MITVNVSIDKDKRECSLMVKGHAGQANIGQDIICASASILAFTAAQVVDAMSRNEELAGEPTLDLGSGDTTVSCRAKNDATFMDLLQTFYTVAVGYKLLVHNHPQFVELTIDGEDI